MKTGIRLTALYAYGCQAAASDSPVGQAIKHYLTTGQDEECLWRQHLGHLEPRHYYHLLLKTKHTRALDDFNPAIVRDYWFGNSVVLPTVHTLFTPHGGFNKLTPRPKSIGAYFLHQGVRPYHNFLVIAKAAVTGLLSRAPLPEVNLPLNHLVNRCLILWGKVDLVDKLKVIVVYKPLNFNTQSGQFAQSSTTQIILDRTFLKSVKKGDVVSFHYDHAREILSDYQRRRLQKYTRLAIDVLNNSYRLARLAKSRARK